MSEKVAVIMLNMIGEVMYEIQTAIVVVFVNKTFSSHCNLSTKIVLRNYLCSFSIDCIMSREIFQCYLLHEYKKNIKKSDNQLQFLMLFTDIRYLDLLLSSLVKLIHNKNPQKIS